MTIDWPSFTPVSALVGGVLIGLATALLALGTGRIAGISGIAAGIAAGPDREWRAAFLLGLVLAPWLVSLGAPASVQLEAGPTLLVNAGVLVGIGTRLSGGCTSGHGVCGLARRSPRSLVATITFMGFGMLTVLAVRHGGLGWITR